jgi:hypothetical protein
MAIEKLSAIQANPYAPIAATKVVQPVDSGVKDPSFQGAVASFAKNNNPFASSSDGLTYQGAFNNTGGKLGDGAITLGDGKEAGRNLFLMA